MMEKNARQSFFKSRIVPEQTHRKQNKIAECQLLDIASSIFSNLHSHRGKGSNSWILMRGKRAFKYSVDIAHQ